MIDLAREEVRAAVRHHYSLMARGESADCGCSSECCATEAGKDQGEPCGCSSSCCGAPAAATVEQAAQILGYGIQELASLPPGANLGLGCGNPQAMAALGPGETVLDLGSGGGIDCFLAARSVGPFGHVVGVDMTADMVARARKTAADAGYTNVEFRLGEIEHLPVADASVDVILSNCVVNLSPDKPQVWREAFRVLKQGGRLAISDMVASGPIPEALRNDLSLHAQCITGSTPLAELEQMLIAAGFKEIRIRPRAESREFVKDWAPGSGIEDFILSATIEAVKA